MVRAPGVVLVSTADGRWMIPPGHGLLIPAGLQHEAEVISNVEMHSIYVHPDLFQATSPRVVEITDLASSLISNCWLRNISQLLFTGRVSCAHFCWMK